MAQIQYFVTFSPKLKEEHIAQLKAHKIQLNDDEIQLNDDDSDVTILKLYPNRIGNVLNRLFIVNDNYKNESISFKENRKNCENSIPFHWDYIRHHLDKNLTEILNQFRNKYFISLKKDLTDTIYNKYISDHTSSTLLLKKEDLIKFEFAGTYDKTTYSASLASDIDCNISIGNGCDNVLTPELMQFIIYEKQKIHEKKFTRKIEQMFDINFYIVFMPTSFPSSSWSVCTVLCKKQHTFALHRAFKILSEKKLIQSLLTNSPESPKLQDFNNGISFKENALESDVKNLTSILQRSNDLTRQASATMRPLSATMRRPSSTFVACEALRSIGSSKSFSMNSQLVRPIQLTYEDDSNLCDTIEELARIYTLTKFNEHEVYHSLGAYFHIVGNRKDLPKFMYVDSALDNWGFMLENLFDEKIIEYTCLKAERISLTYRLLRVAKYLERICIAFLIFLDDIKTPDIRNRIIAIKDKCNTLNILRKNENNVDDLTHLLSQNGIEYLNLKKLSNEKDIEESKNELFKIELRNLYVGWLKFPLGNEVRGFDDINEKEWHETIYNNVIIHILPYLTCEVSSVPSTPRSPPSPQSPRGRSILNSTTSPSSSTPGSPSSPPSPPSPLGRKGTGGVPKSRLLHILGRNRRLIRKGRTTTLIYFGQRITLTQARLIERTSKKGKAAKKK